MDDQPQSDGHPTDGHQSDGKGRAIFTTLRLPAVILLALAIMLIVGILVSR